MQTKVSDTTKQQNTQHEFGLKMSKPEHVTIATWPNCQSGNYLTTAFPLD